MAKSLESPTKLTEFAPINADAPSASAGIRSTLARWFGIQKAPGPLKDDSEAPVKGSYMDAVTVSSERSSTPTSSLYSEGRTLTGVVERISNLLAQRGVYSEADFKQYWMPDSVSKECYDCGDRFTAIRRRHHCRICGQIFCSKCCHQQVPGKLMGYSGDLRACTYCCQVVLSYLQSIDTLDTSVDLKKVQDELQQKLANLKPVVLVAGKEARNVDSPSRTSTLKRRVSVSFQEERFAAGTLSSQSQLLCAERKALLEDSTQLKTLHEEISHPQTGIPLQHHRYKLRSIPNCFVGSEVVDWLLAHDKASSRMQAVAIGQALVDAKYLENLSSGEQIFVDAYTLYRPSSVVTDTDTLSQSDEKSRTLEIQGIQEPLWVQQIGAQEENAVTSRPTSIELSSGAAEESGAERPRTSTENVKDTLENYIPPQRKRDDFLLSTETSMPLLNSPTYPPSTVSPCDHSSSILDGIFEQHQIRILRQLLSSHGLSQSWYDVLLPLIQNISHTVRPNVKDDDDDMDIRHYVHFKKLPGGLRSDSRVVYGVVCSKNVSNRNMAQYLQDPSILLLSSAIDYQRVGTKFISLESLMMQENEYLKNAVAKIAAFKPEVLLVEKVVSGIAQEFLHNLGITLALNMKPSVMDRVSRCCQADLVPSIDAHLTKPKLGSCRLFHVEQVQLDSHRSKTLMFFEGCPSRLGCTVLLRGGSSSELRQVKKVLQFMIYVAYHSTLERAFLTGEFAVPKMACPLADIFEESLSDSNVADGSRITDSGSDASFVVVVNASSLVEAQTSPYIVVNEVKDNIRPVPELDDPLHAYLRSKQGDVSLNSTPVETKLLSFSIQSPVSTSELFRKSLEDTVLCISPLIQNKLPYLETESGKNSVLAKYLPSCLYFSRQFSHESPPRKMRYDDVTFKESPLNTSGPVVELPDDIHPFLKMKITSDLPKVELQTLLADFRARGARQVTAAASSKAWRTSLLSGVAERGENKVEEDCDEKEIDCLDIGQHQRLYVLFSSHCPVSQTSPAFCVAPWIIQMDFYGRNDISLGGFLERFCFQTNYACPSSQCQFPVTSHVRRFVHDQGCIQVLVRQLSSPLNCSADKPDDSILMWTWCRKCKLVSPISIMSFLTWHMSFAKYLELRLHGHGYNRRSMENGASSVNVACQHPIHSDHFHYFGCRDLVASFKYIPVSLREIVLPPVPCEMTLQLSAVPLLVEEIRNLALTGHSIYSAIADWLTALSAECFGTKLENNVAGMVEQQLQEKLRFRKRIEEIQIMLTSPLLQSSPRRFQKLPEVEEHLWNILDHQVLLKRILADTVSSWNSRLGETVAAKKKEDKAAASKPARSLASYSNHVSSQSLDIETPKTSEVSEPVFQDSQTVPESSKILELSSSSSLSDSPSSKSSQAKPRSNSDLIASSETSEESSAEIRHHRRSSSQASGSDITDSKQKTSLGILLSSTSSNPPLANPFPPTEHHLLPPGSSLPLVVYENEPSSIIAYAMSSVDYDKQLAELQNDLANQANQTAEAMGHQPNGSGAERWYDNVDREEQGMLKSSMSAASMSSHIPPTIFSNQHLEVQFSDSSTRFYCRVYFAEQFRALRASIFPHGEERFIRSLSRCVSWAALGGKSGSTFCKTVDDRFVLKQMSRMEVQSFIDLAPGYVAYLQKCISENRPTALCKIFGAFRIVFKNSQTNVASKQDLLVMENLFYGAQITRKFDLKGSERNRLVSSAEAAHTDCVLLDENLMKMMGENPLYVRGYSRNVLISALSSDTQFLASHLVMDYSLLVGLDEENNQLVVGIIDYIRTFTWDKRLETFVKSSGILGGQGKMPTVVSPELYRTRFCEAMNKYFLPVPNRWTGLSHSFDT